MSRLEWNEAEMLLALWHLRYLTTEQLNRFAYRRTYGGCVKRLSRLKAAGVLERVVLGEGAYRSAWRLGPEGLRHLRAVKDGEFAPTDPVSAKFVPHILDTNQVFMALCGDEQVWERLPFSWRGSHRVQLRYRRNRFESDSERQRIIRPDAMVVTASRRMFVELDRSSECLSPKDGRRSITSKLEAYRHFILGWAPGGRRWYEHAFADGKSPRVLFVLSKRDGRARDPKLRDRRMRAITKLAVDVFQRSDTPVRLAYLDDGASIARACRLTPQLAVSTPPPMAKPSSSPALSRDDVLVFERLLAFYTNLWRRLRRESQTREPARIAARLARERLVTLAGRNLDVPELQTIPGGLR